MAQFGDPFSTHGPIETTLEVTREGGRRWYKHDEYLKIKQSDNNRITITFTKEFNYNSFTNLVQIPT